MGKMCHVAFCALNRPDMVDTAEKKQVNKEQDKQDQEKREKEEKAAKDKDEKEKEDQRKEAEFKVNQERLKAAVVDENQLEKEFKGFLHECGAQLSARSGFFVSVSRQGFINFACDTVSNPACRENRIMRFIPADEKDVSKGAKIAKLLCISGQPLYTLGSYGLTKAGTKVVVVSIGPSELVYSHEKHK